MKDIKIIKKNNNIQFYFKKLRILFVLTKNLEKFTYMSSDWCCYISLHIVIIYLNKKILKFIFLTLKFSTIILLKKLVKFESFCTFCIFNIKFSYI